MDCYAQELKNNVELPLNCQLPLSFESSRKIGGMRKKRNADNKINKRLSDDIQKMFGKCIKIDNKSSELPAPNTMFTENPWKNEYLQKIKTNLNDVKSKLNDYNLKSWRRHTKKRNYAGHIIWQIRQEINPENLTQAWCKFYENLCFFELIPEKCEQMKKLKSIHLCEAPGAFVSALNHWLKLNKPLMKWDWTATSLNPLYEGNSLCYMLNDDRFILDTLSHWNFGIDNTGNLMNIKNLDSLVESEANNRDDIMLITADGSIDCFDVANEQESFVSRLHYCEAVAALHLLNKNGNFLLKLFTVFEYQTICLLYLLSCSFNQVFIRKPATSKGANSEIYLCCLDFKGADYISPYLNILRKQYINYTDRSMFRMDDIPGSFIKQIIECGEFFKSHQCEVILNNIKTFNLPVDRNDVYLKKIRKAMANHYIKFCNLTELPFGDMRIVTEKKVDQAFSNIFENKTYDSYNDRLIKNSMEPGERLLTLIDSFKHICETNDTKVIQLTENKMEKLIISKAISYESIKSSRFCEPKILQIFHLACEVKNKLIAEQSWFETDAITNYMESNKNHCKFIIFNHTLEFTSFDVIRQIYSTITILQRDQTLILIGYSLLTQFNVGILYFLAHTFKHFEIRVDPNIGCIITFRNYVCEQSVIEYLKNIFHESTKAGYNNNIILSVVPVVRLCERDLYSIIVDVNHFVIKNFVNKIATIVKCNNSK